MVMSILVHLPLAAMEALGVVEAAAKPEEVALLVKEIQAAQGTEQGLVVAVQKILLLLEPVVIVRVLMAAQVAQD
jgi:hypothetical protein